MAKQRETFDVVIIGGGMTGSAIAWWLTQMPEFNGTIAMIEADPSYEWASTSHTNSCIRQQFGTAINVEISQFGAQFVQNFKSYMGDSAPDIPIQNFGYMYLADTEAGANALRAKAQLQNTLSVPTQLYSPDQLKTKFPFYELDDVVLASHNVHNEGYFDGGTIFDWFRKGAMAGGVTYIHGRAAQIDHADGQIQTVHLDDGTCLNCGILVNAAGPRANEIMRMVDLSIPVEPRKRFTYVFKAANPLDQPLPLTIDPSGVHVRSDGAYYMAGCAPLDDQPAAYDDFDLDHDLWQSHVWPIIATRIPAFEQIRVIHEWTGHYAYNTLDQNAILGPHPDMPNLYMANGFSGHGLQQAPAVGRGIAEHITHGGYKTIDLSPLGMERILANRPLREPNVI